MSQRDQIRHGRRLAPLPVEPYEAEAFPPPEPRTWLEWLVIAGSLVGGACLLYMLARVIFG